MWPRDRYTGPGGGMYTGPGGGLYTGPGGGLYTGPGGGLYDGPGGGLYTGPGGGLYDGPGGGAVCWSRRWLICRTMSESLLVQSTAATYSNRLLEKHASESNG